MPKIIVVPFFPDTV